MSSDWSIRRLRADLEMHRALEELDYEGCIGMELDGPTDTSRRTEPREPFALAKNSYAMLKQTC